MVIRISVFFFFLLNITSLPLLYAQENEKPFIKLVNPLTENNTVTASRQFIVGSTCKSCTLKINEEQVKVYSSGGFAFELNLVPGTADTVFKIEAGQAANKKNISKKIIYSFTPARPADSVSVFNIESIQTFPEGNLLLKPGDKIQFKVKALPGSSVTVMSNTTLYELPPQLTAGMKGIYQGEYMVSQTDSFSAIKIPVTLRGKDGQVLIKETRDHFSVFSDLASDVAITTGRLAHLVYGLGTDRLGGAKIGYLDSLVQLLVVGKVGNNYKIKLADSRVAYIPEEHVKLMPKGSFSPRSLTGSWNVYGDSTHDYVNLSLSSRLPYQSFHELNPSRIIVDVFGATNNSNWISQLKSVEEIDNVDYEQVADDIFRIKIQLKHVQHWGHQVYYKGNTLVIKIKRQPADLSLGKLTIAVDAGHGGTNMGASGPTGSSEKKLALAVALKLQQNLQAAGTKVMMTRTTERTVDNTDRILMFRDSIPDLLVSIHLNSSSDPLRASGTSTHYRYLGNKKLNAFVNQRMQELGLKQYGVIGSFNFMLNSPVEYPNVLIETLFISNPEEEALILDEGFQQQMADKIVQGLKDFLSDAAK